MRCVCDNIVLAWSNVAPLGMGTDDAFISARSETALANPPLGSVTTLGTSTNSAAPST